MLSKRAAGNWHHESPRRMAWHTSRITLAAVLIGAVVLYCVASLTQTHSHIDTDTQQQTIHTQDGTSINAVYQVCSHKAYLSPSFLSSSSSVLVSPVFPPTPSSLSITTKSALSPPVFQSSMLSFLQHNITCFDLDVFVSVDDVLFVGHPSDTTQYLQQQADRYATAGQKQMDRPQHKPTNRRLAIETYTSTEIQTLDTEGYIITFPALLTFLTDLLISETSAVEWSLIALEPKGQLISKSGTQRIAQTITTTSSLVLAQRLAVLVTDGSIAEYINRLYPDLLLSLPIRNVKPSATAAFVCDQTRSTNDRKAALGPYSIIQPSYKLLLTCGLVANQPATDILQDLRVNQSKRIFTWVVDDVSTAAKIAASSDFIVSNRPYDIPRAQVRSTPARLPISVT